MDFAQRKGARTFGTRLRRLSDGLDREVSRLYAEFGVSFEPRWYPVVALLAEKEPLGVMDMAGALGLSHPAVSQVVRQLSDEGLVTSTPDAADERRRLLTLTDKARERMTELEPLWSAIVLATEELVTEDVPGLLILIDELDRALEKKSLGDRVHEHLDVDNQ